MLRLTVQNWRDSFHHIAVLSSCRMVRSTLLQRISGQGNCSSNCKIFWKIFWSREAHLRWFEVSPCADSSRPHAFSCCGSLGWNRQTLYAESASKAIHLFCQRPMMKMKVCKAVFPAAGLGTRFLPATKAQPKEMLPLVDKPIIQYGVEEALAAGCDQ